MTLPARRLVKDPRALDDLLRTGQVRRAPALDLHRPRPISTGVPTLDAALGGGLMRGQLHSRVPATLLIALGGFIPGVTSGLNRFGITWAFFLGELLGVLLIFAGFVVSTEVFGARVRLGPIVMRREEEAPAT